MGEELSAHWALLPSQGREGQGDILMCPGEHLLDIVMLLLRYTECHGSLPHTNGCVQRVGLDPFVPTSIRLVERTLSAIAP